MMIFKKDKKFLMLSYNLGDRYLQDIFSPGSLQFWYQSIYLTLQNHSLKAEIIDTMELCNGWLL